MKTLNKIFSKKAFVALIVLAAFISSCVFLDSVNCPSELVSGQYADFTMNVRVNPGTTSSGEKLIIAVLMPSSWNPATNVTVNYESTAAGDTGTQTMTLIPESVHPFSAPTITWPQHLQNTFGVGPNLLNTMQWVAFQSDKSYTLPENQEVTATVHVRALIGSENLKAKLGFFVNNSGDGLSTDTARWKVLYSDCLPVTGASGALNDYCTGEVAAAKQYNEVAAGSPYPNPFSRTLSIPLKLNAGAAYEVTVFDVTGKKLAYYNSVATKNNEVMLLNEKLNFDQFDSGVYMVNVKSDKASSSFKVIKK